MTYAERINYLLLKLMENKEFNTKEEIVEFEERLSELSKMKDINTIKELCSLLSDETEHHEVMYSIVHSIEYIYAGNKLEGLSVILDMTGNMLEESRDWLKIIYYRLLNLKETRLILRGLIKNLQVDKKDVIIKILNDLKMEDSDFSEYVNEILD